MEQETDAQRMAREQRLKEICEPLGFAVNKSQVIAAVGAPMVVDASAVDSSDAVVAVQQLIWLFRQEAAKQARKELVAGVQNIAAGLSNWCAQAQGGKNPPEFFVA